MNPRVGIHPEHELETVTALGGEGVALDLLPRVGEALCADPGGPGTQVWVQLPPASLNALNRA
jgi:hypothetical protein